MREAPPPSAISPEVAAVMLLSAVSATLGMLSHWGPALGIAVALLTVGDGVVLRWTFGERGRELAVLPYAIGLGVLVLAVPYSFASALLAGAGGLGILLWLVPAWLPGGAWGEGSRALLLPVLGLFLVLATATVLSGIRTYLGFGLLLWIGLLVLLLWVYGHPRSFLLEAPAPSGRRTDAPPEGP
jgi:hypothetical protein